MKRIFISADIEGCTDVTCWAETERGNDQFDKACEQMTKEVAAACEAIIEAGYEPVVRDGHGDGMNIDHSMLPRGTKLMRGWANHPGSMMAGINEKYDGAVFIGYHAPAGTNGSPLAHTVELADFRWVKVNGELASEFTLNRLYAAQFGVPAIMISGDKCICELAEKEVPGILTAPVKECKGDSTLNMHPDDACDLIKAKVSEALKKNFERVKPVTPIVLEACLMNHQAARDALKIDGIEKVDDFTVKYTAKSATEMQIVRERIMG